MDPRNLLITSRVFTGNYLPRDEGKSWIQGSKCETLVNSLAGSGEVNGIERMHKRYGPLHELGRQLSYRHTPKKVQQEGLCSLADSRWFNFQIVCSTVLCKAKQCNRKMRAQSKSQIRSFRSREVSRACERKRGCRELTRHPHRPPLLD
jgi:hypothetical protein